MTELTDYLKELKELEEKATKGPWRADWGNWEIETVNSRKFICDYSPIQQEEKYRTITDPRDNAEFIAASRTAIPKLIRIIEVQAEALEQLQERCWSPECECNNKAAKEAQSEVDRIFKRDEK